MTITECPKCAHTGWICTGNCPDKYEHRREDCERPMWCDLCYRRNRVPCPQYVDPPRVPATVFRYLCGHGAVYDWVHPLECPDCAAATDRLIERAEFAQRVARRGK